MTEVRATVTIACHICGQVTQVDLYNQWSDDGAHFVGEPVLHKLQASSCSHIASVWFSSAEDELTATRAAISSNLSWFGRRKSYAERRASAPPVGSVPLKQAAATIGVAERTLKRWRATGKLTERDMFQGPSGRWFVSVFTIEDHQTRRQP